jgi:hypothetical protein
MSNSEKPKTRFEQVPLEIVKKIAKEDIPEDELDEADGPVELPEEE